MTKNCNGNVMKSIILPSPEDISCEKSLRNFVENDSWLQTFNEIYLKKCLVHNLHTYKSFLYNIK